MDIKKFVKNLITEYKTNDPFTIADKKGIIVRSLSLGHTLGFQLHDSRFSVIHINSDLSENMQNFVCAHELGHAILHKNIHTNYLKYYSFFTAGKIERQAHKFAIELILPDYYLEEYKDFSVYQLAQMHGIPENLVRLKTL